MNDSRQEPANKVVSLFAGANQLHNGKECGITIMRTVMLLQHKQKVIIVA